jgi:hypothetical protein
VTDFGWNAEVEDAARILKGRHNEVERLLATPADCKPGDWQHRFAKAADAEMDARNSYNSAVIWADLDNALAYHPAPPGLEAGQ